MFVADINTNPGNAYADCDTNATDYNASKASSFWTSLFPFTPYAGTVNNSSNTAAVSVTLAGTGGGGVYTFAMVNNKNLGSDNWVISKITDPSSTVIFQ